MKHQLSFVIPVYNEEDTIKILFERISAVMEQESIPNYEVIFINDGSKDNSWLNIKELVACYPQYVKAICFRKNFGKAAALSAGFQKSQGDIVFTLDADLQDAPEEIPKFLQKLHQGYDLVSGWRKRRNDPLSKNLPSKLYNQVTSILTGIKLHDFNCGFKAYRKEILASIKVYGELHRYIPVLAYELGYQVGEVAIQHCPRQHGVSKYGWERYTRGFLDLLTVIATTRFLHKPGHLFGNLGLIFGLVGILIIFYLIILWFLGMGPIGTRPLLFFGIMSVIISVQMISLGILAELITRQTSSNDLEQKTCEVLNDSNFSFTETQTEKFIN